MGEIIPITKNDISGRRTDATHKIEDFVGVVAQSVVDVNDNYRLHIMDGTNRGGHPVAMLDSDNEFKNSIAIPDIEDLAYADEDNNSKVANIGDTKKLINEKVDTGLKTKIDHTIAKDGVDVNELISDGIYYVTNGTNTANLSSGMLHVYANGTTIVQVWLECLSEDPKVVHVYHRYKSIDLSDFTSWFRVLNTKDVDINNVAYINKENTFTENNTFTSDVHIDGDLTGKTIESKLDHSKAITAESADTLLEDGIFLINSSMGDLPDEAVLPAYIHIFSDDNFILQALYSINGYIYLRAKSGDSFSQWSGGDVDFPIASLDKAGIVQLTNIISAVDESKAITPKAVHGVYSLATSAKTQAEANQEAITNLVSNVNLIEGKYINTVNIPSGVDGSPTVELPVLSNTITIAKADTNVWGLTRAASINEVASGSSNYTFISPATLGGAIDNKVDEAVKKLESENKLVSFEVVDSDTPIDVTKDNTIYFITD